MTMPHIARSFKVSLWVTHPDIDPAEISTTLGLAPHTAKRAGAPRTTPKGDPLKGTYEFSSWTHQFEVEEASELGTLLEDLVKRLRSYQSFFHRVVQEGGAVELFCGVFVAGNWDEILSHSLMGQLAAIHVDLRLDVYAKDNEKVA